MLKRAEEYIHLYLDRYRCRRISRDVSYFCESFITGTAWQEGEVIMFIRI
jgi:hypothetical protein